MKNVLREGANEPEAITSRTASPDVSHAAHFEVERVPLIQPLPWVAVCDGHDGRIYDANGLIVVTALTPDEAAFIVRACNSHDDLLDIARTIVALCDSGNVEHAQLACMETSPLVDAARAAIAKAEGS